MNLKFPPWLRQKLLPDKKYSKTKQVIDTLSLFTVCEEAKCPNRFYCFEKKCATFLSLGKFCTRKCQFCDVCFSPSPSLPDPLEPKKIALAAKKLNLKHVVITMVTRDDLEDGGANHISEIIKEVKKENPKSSIEVLTSDFQGKDPLLDVIIQARPNIFNHNIETTESLSSKIRNNASYSLSLKVLSYVKEKERSILVKSGLMVGLGEKEDEVKETITHLKENGCDIITIGQYLKPSSKCIEVKEFISPEIFKKYEEFGYSIGVKYIYSGPFVRSSFNAEKILSENFADLESQNN